MTSSHSDTPILRYPDTFFLFLLRHRIALLVICSGLAGAALFHLSRLPIDVWPNLSPVQVQILTPVPDLAAPEVEASITRMLEIECAGLPQLGELRSVSTFGLSQLTLVFRDGTDLWQARQRSQEKIQNALPRLPKGCFPRLGPPSDALGEVFSYALVYRPGAAPDLTTAQRLANLKAWQDFVVRPRLLTVPGIVEINTTGGFDRQIVVEPDIRKLYAAGLDLKDLAVALEQGVAIGGSGLLNVNGEQQVIRSAARAQTIADLAGSSVRLSWGSVAINVKDLAVVREGEKIRFGAATLDGEEAVVGTVLIENHGDATAAAGQVKAKLGSLVLPADVEVIPLYNRAALTRNVLQTAARNLGLATVVVTGVLWFFFRRLRAALITVAVIPLAFVFGLAASSAVGTSGNLMSLGALDLGLIVDGAVVVVDSYLLRLRQAQDAGIGLLPAGERFRLAARSTQEVAGPMAYGWLIILIGYTPAFFLPGLDRAIFQPMALTAVCALLAALPLSLLLVPTLAATFLREPPGASALAALGMNRYLSCLRYAERRRVACMGLALGICVAGWVGAERLGFDLLPPLDEGSTVLEVEKPVAMNLDASLAAELGAERFIRAEFPEIKQVYSRLGFSDVATDPQAPNQNDIYLSYRPRPEWPLRGHRRFTKAELERRIKESLEAAFPDSQFGLNQPIRTRLDEMLEGTHADVAIELLGADLNALNAAAEKVAEVMAKVPGASDVLSEPVGLIPSLTFLPDRPALSRYLVKAAEIDQSLSAGLMGREVGRVDESDRFYPIVVRLPEEVRRQPGSLLKLPVRSAEGTIMLTLGQLGRLYERGMVNRILHQDQQRRRTVLVNVRGRDLGGFVHQARAEVAREIQLPGGVRMVFGGHYQLMEAAFNRLLWIVPLMLIVIAGCVLAALRSLPLTGAVLTALPFAVVGGIFALAARGFTLSVSAGLGLAAVAGVALLNKLVFVDAYRRRRREGLDAWDAVAATTRARLRPVLSTAAVASAGFLPMALSNRVGAEVQRPIAWVMVGGLVTSTLVTLFLLPLFLLAIERAGRKPGRRTLRPVVRGEPEQGRVDPMANQAR